MPDTILEELWSIKDQLASECGQDLRRLFDRLKKLQEHHDEDIRTVNRTGVQRTCSSCRQARSE